MQRLLRFARLLIAISAGLLVAAQMSPACAAEDAAPEVLAEFPLNNCPSIVREVEAIESDGVVRLVQIPGDGQPFGVDGDQLTEGYYLGFLKTAGDIGLTSGSLLRARVIEIDESGALRVQVGPAAVDRMKRGQYLSLLRPRGTATAEMKAVPDILTIEEGQRPTSKANDEARESDTSLLAQSTSNLRRIGLALHQYHDVFGCFPLAVLCGADGEPWHSWRVLLLPFLGEGDLYNEYRFEEPWDGPHNKQLIGKMPSVYSDPRYGENEEHYAHYSTITGSGMAFSAERLPSTEGRFRMTDGTKFARVTDGLSNTLAIGPVAPDARIVWSEPRDLELTDSFSELGAKGSFALPYVYQDKKCGPFLVCDGSVAILSSATDKAAFRALATIDGGERFDWPSSGRLTLQSHIESRALRWAVLYILRAGDETKAVLSGDR